MGKCCGFDGSGGQLFPSFVKRITRTCDAKPCPHDLVRPNEWKGRSMDGVYPLDEIAKISQEGNTLVCSFHSPWHPSAQPIATVQVGLEADATVQNFKASRTETIHIPRLGLCDLSVITRARKDSVRIIVGTQLGQFRGRYRVQEWPGCNKNS